MAIPVVLLTFARRRRDLPYPWMFWMFGAFIVGCGLTHLMEVVTSYVPLYRLAGAVKLLTAAVSVVTAAALVPKALALRGPAELEAEIARRRGVEGDLRLAQEGLERRVAERTAELARTNDALRTEVTERQRAEAALRRERERYRCLVHGTAHIVWVRDAAAGVREDSPSWRAFTGQTFEQMAGDGWLDAVHPGDRPRVAAAWRDAVAGRTPYDIEYRLGHHAGGYRRVQGRGVPVAGPGGDEWVGMNIDVTERREAEEGLRRARDELELRVAARTDELARANQELARSNKELESFAFVASHDLQEPLRKVRTFGDLLQAECGEALGDAGRDYVGRMRAAAGRMADLIESLLDYSRVTTRERPFVRVDLGQAARDAVSDLEGRVLQTGGRVEVGDLPAVRADPGQMRQLLQNLIANGLKFHRPGVPPVVRVRADISPAGGGPAACVLTVEDEGIGFDEAHKDRIFEVFQRLHGRGAYEGTGIGLAICKKIVERHGGTIVASAVKGRGATFVVTLPLDQGETKTG